MCEGGIVLTLFCLHVMVSVHEALKNKLRNTEAAAEDEMQDGSKGILSWWIMKVVRCCKS